MMFYLKIYAFTEQTKPKQHFIYFMSYCKRTKSQRKDGNNNPMEHFQLLLKILDATLN